MFSETKAAALYVRAVNNRTDNTNSVEIQIEQLEKYAHENGFLNTVIYSDIGTNKTPSDRKELSRLINDIKKGKIDTVIVTDFSRFGRLNHIGMYLINTLFPEYNVKFIEIKKSSFDRNKISSVYDMLENYTKHKRV